MEEYKKLVQELFLTRSDKIIANSSDKHAAVLFAAFFQYAEKSIYIFSERLSRNVFEAPDVLENAKEFIQKTDTKLYIGLMADRPEYSSFLKLLQTYHKTPNIRIMKFPKMIADGKCVNFAVMDDCGYRFEPDYQKCSAIASANDPLFAMRLKKAFEDCIPDAKTQESH